MGAFTTEAWRVDLVRPRVLRASLFILIWIFFDGSGAASGSDQTIEFFESIFLPQSVAIERGESVSWVWRKGTHTVTSGLPGGQPGTPDGPGELFDALLDSAHPSFTRVFGEAGTEGFSFFCREHPSQIGFVSIASGEIAFRVAVVDNIFNPEDVFIFEGDSVRWEHEPNEGFHTVTSGLSSREADLPGALFDEESSDQRPLFVYRFAEAGVYPYFCRPHEHMGMKGTVRVQRKFLRGDSQGDGAVELTDTIAALEFLFLGSEARACDDAMDANDDGQVNIGDPIFLLFFLFAGGAAPAKPYPLPGPDRTEDGLLCSP